MIEAARRISRGPRTYWTDQLNNQDSVVGYYALGEEIWGQTKGEVDAFVHCAGTAASSRGVAGALRPGGVAVFHEYADYASWRLAPPRPANAEFVREVMADWRASGGEPDVAPALVGVLTDAGFAIREAVPRVFCVGPRDHAWRWAASFTEIHLGRLLELGRVGPAWAEAVRQEFRAAQADARTLMITPMVLEVIAERSP